MVLKSLIYIISSRRLAAHLYLAPIVEKIHNHIVGCHIASYIRQEEKLANFSVSPE